MRLDGSLCGRYEIYRARADTASLVVLEGGVVRNVALAALDLTFADLVAANGHGLSEDHLIPADIKLFSQLKLPMNTHFYQCSKMNYTAFLHTNYYHHFQLMHRLNPTPNNK